MAKAAENTTNKSAKPGFGERFTGFFKGIGKAFKNMWHELKKVTWPTKQDLIKYSCIVLVFMLFMGIVIGLLDMGSSRLVTAISSLKGTDEQIIVDDSAVVVDPEQAAETVEEAAEEAAETAEEAAEQAGEAVQEAAEQAGEAVQEAAEQAGEAVQEAAEEVVEAAEEAAQTPAEGN